VFGEHGCVVIEERLAFPERWLVFLGVVTGSVHTSNALDRCRKMKAFALVVCARRTRAERFFHIEASSNGIVREKEASELNILLRLYHSEQEKNTIHVHQFAALEYLDFPDTNARTLSLHRRQDIRHSLR